MRFAVRLSLGLFLAVYSLIGSGCATQLNLTMKKDLPPKDRSIISPKLNEKRIRKILIIPPEGTPRRDLETKILLFEGEFLKRGISVISGEIAGRLVMDAIGAPDEKKLEAARSLSEMERVLAMAGATGADAILQLVEFRWVFPKVDSRYFIGDPEDKSNFRETSYDDWHAWSGPKRNFSAPTWIFVGRAVDATSGEVLASYDLAMPANFSLPEDYGALYLYTPVENRITKSKLIAESFPYGGDAWLLRAMERTETRVIAQVAASMNAQTAGPPAAASPALPPGPAGPETSPASPPEKSAESPPEKPAAPPSAAVASPETAISPLPATVKKLYTIQIKAFRDRAGARKFAAKVKKTLPDVRSVRTKIKRKGTWYRILVGPFCTKDEADRYRQAKGIDRLYPDSFIRSAGPPSPRRVAPRKQRTFIGP